jgi:DMSO/TMAO reductase YedYZ molybdopterin-dependent catalytic subunit
MNRKVFAWGALYGALAGIIVVALTYLGERLFSLSFLPFDIFDWLARILPGPLVSFVIDLIVRLTGQLNLGPTASAAKQIEQGIAIIELILAGTIFGLVLAGLGRRKPHSLILYGFYGGVILWLAAILIELSVGFPGVETGTLPMIFSSLWLGLVLIGGGALLGRLLHDTYMQTEGKPEETAGAVLSRRQFLYLIGAGSAAVVVSAIGLALFPQEEKAAAGVATTETGSGLPEIGAFDTSGPAASPPRNALDARIQPTPGTRPELTSNQDFYRVDINTIPPQVNGNTWQLKLDGQVENPLTLSLDEIKARPSTSQVITLECISNQVGGDLISTALYTGVTLKSLLDEAKMKPNAQALSVKAVDGFYETVSMQDMMDERTLLVYEMNQQPLPVEHGYPLRLYIPNHFGMKQPKWITHMQVIDNQGSGYWEDRGWSEQAIPETTSVIDAIDTNQVSSNSNSVPIGGIAYAGARGISKVEIKIDDGAWEETELRDPPLSSLTWVQWRYNWQASPGKHLVSVRAYDGAGKLQQSTETPPYPDGATGINTKNAVVLS